MTQPIAWDDVVATYRRLTETVAGPHDIWIIGPAAYEDLYRRTPVEDRPGLAAMRERGELIISPDLPEGVAGYRYTPPSPDA